MLDQQTLLTDPSKIFEPAPALDYEDLICNEYGAIRWHFIRSLYYNGKISKKEVVEFYRTWRDDPEYFILRGLLEDATVQERLIPKQDPYTIDPEHLEIGARYLYKFIKASKRGNDVYQRLVSNKLKLLNEVDNIIFFNDHSADKRTAALSVVLTCDDKRCDPDTAWENIGKEFHLFHNNLRKMYGSVEVFRTWESTNNYYPHVHMIILFWDHSFPVIQHQDKDGSLSYRIPYHEKEKIAKHWHSHVDVQVLDDTKGGIKELTKYITKDLCSDKGDKTNAMICLHGKQSYAISKGFMKAITGWYIEFNEPTNVDLINQMCNCNHDVVKWEFIGILRGVDLGFSSNVWCVDLKKPPPRVSKLILYEYERWKSLHGGRY